MIGTHLIKVICEGNLCHGLAAKNKVTLQSSYLILNLLP